MRLRSQTLTSSVFIVIFSNKNHGFVKKDKPSENVATTEEELNRLDIGDIENLRAFI